MQGKPADESCFQLQCFKAQWWPRGHRSRRCIQYFSKGQSHGPASRRRDFIRTKHADQSSISVGAVDSEVIKFQHVSSEVMLTTHSISLERLLLVLGGGSGMPIVLPSPSPRMPPRMPRACRQMVRSSSIRSTSKSDVFLHQRRLEPPGIARVCRLHPRPRRLQQASPSGRRH